MAKRVPILGANTLPDTSGNCWAEPYSVAATNDTWPYLVYRFKDTATRVGLRGLFEVPQDYVNGASIKPVWTSTATSGNTVWDFDYRAVAGDDTTSLDQTSNTESVTVTDAAPGAAHRRLTPTLAVTAGNFVAGSTIQFTLFRDGTDAADTMAADALLHGLYFEYS